MLTIDTTAQSHVLYVPSNGAAVPEAVVLTLTHTGEGVPVQLPVTTFAAVGTYLRLVVTLPSGGLTLGEYDYLLDDGDGKAVSRGLVNVSGEGPDVVQYNGGQKQTYLEYGAEDAE